MSLGKRSAGSVSRQTSEGTIGKNKKTFRNASHGYKGEFAQQVEQIIALEENLPQTQWIDFPWGMNSLIRNSLFVKDSDELPYAWLELLYRFVYKEKLSKERDVLPYLIEKRSLKPLSLDDLAYPLDFRIKVNCTLVVIDAKNVHTTEPHKFFQDRANEWIGKDLLNVYCFFGCVPRRDILRHTYFDVVIWVRNSPSDYFPSARKYLHVGNKVSNIDNLWRKAKRRPDTVESYVWDRCVYFKPSGIPQSGFSNITFGKGWIIGNKNQDINHTFLCYDIRPYYKTDRICNQIGGGILPKPKTVFRGPCGLGCFGPKLEQLADILLGNRFETYPVYADDKKGQVLDNTFSVDIGKDPYEFSRIFVRDHILVRPHNYELLLSETYLTRYDGIARKKQTTSEKLAKIFQTHPYNILRPEVFREGPSSYAWPGVIGQRFKTHDEIFKFTLSIESYVLPRLGEFIQLSEKLKSRVASILSERIGKFIDVVPDMVYDRTRPRNCREETSFSTRHITPTSSIDISTLGAEETCADPPNNNNDIVRITTLNRRTRNGVGECVCFTSGEKYPYVHHDYECMNIIIPTPDKSRELHIRYLFCEMPPYAVNDIIYCDELKNLMDDQPALWCCIHALEKDIGELCDSGIKDDLKLVGKSLWFMKRLTDVMCDKMCMFLLLNTPFFEYVLQKIRNLCHLLQITNERNFKSLHDFRDTALKSEILCNDCGIHIVEPMWFILSEYNTALCRRCALPDHEYTHGLFPRKSSKNVSVCSVEYAYDYGGADVISDEEYTFDLRSYDANESFGDDFVFQWGTTCSVIKKLISRFEDGTIVIYCSSGRIQERDEVSILYDTTKRALYNEARLFRLNDIETDSDVFGTFCAPVKYHILWITNDEIRYRFEDIPPLSNIRAIIDLSCDETSAIDAFGTIVRSSASLDGEIPFYHVYVIDPRSSETCDKAEKLFYHKFA